MKQTEEIAPRSHNLIFLSEKANLEFNEDDEISLGILIRYQLQCRYLDYNPIIPDKSKVMNYLGTVHKLMCLK